jgi:alcohol dehydrogenase class IV
MQLSGTWNYPTTVWFGTGRVAQLPEAARLAGIRNPLLVTDANLAGTPMLQNALAGLAGAGTPAKLFSDVRPNPVEANLAAGVAAFASGKHDGVIAFGGGSVLDVGKLIAFMHRQAHPVWDFEDIADRWTGADAAAIAPVVAVPTTAGTGSEVGRAAVLTDTAAQTKRIIFHPDMMPKVVICDPDVTVGVPPYFTAGTGMDALAHCLEAYCVNVFHPMADGIALEGMRLVKDNLVTAVRKGRDTAARGAMQAAAVMGATAFQKGLGAIHALSHPIGALYDTHHGVTNAVLMPYVLRFNRIAIEEKIERLAGYLDLDASFDAFLDWVLMLREQIEILPTLADLGVTDEHAERIAAMAAADPTAAGNPVPLDAAGAARIFRDALAGRL